MSPCWKFAESYHWLQVQGFASRNTFDDLHEDVDALVEAVWRRLLVDDAVQFGQNVGHGLDEQKRKVLYFQMIFDVLIEGKLVINPMNGSQSCINKDFTCIK